MRRKCLHAFTPFFTKRDRKHAACQHRLFFAQLGYGDHLIFHRRAALDALGQRLLDANRTIGQPNKITVIFGRKITQQYRGKLQTILEDLDLPNPVIRSHYGHGFIQQYVRDHLLPRAEPANNDVRDYAIHQAIEHLPQLPQKAFLHRGSVPRGAAERPGNLRGSCSAAPARSAHPAARWLSHLPGFLKLFERVYAPPTAGLLRPFAADNKLHQQRLSQLDRLYQNVATA